MGKAQLHPRQRQTGLARREVISFSFALYLSSGAHPHGGGDGGGDMGCGAADAYFAAHGSLAASSPRCGPARGGKGGEERGGQITTNITTAGPGQRELLRGTAFFPRSSPKRKRS
ncbi:hypothetical protein BGX38DRAFT_1328268 [Terfezia claveryi]|nr:hypothetical protein BGX38DRAFT_1328268 [Terfezia claveryi]